MASPDRHQRILALFEQVVDLDEAARQVVLEEAYKTDPTLRDEMDTLLASHQAARTESFLNPLFAPEATPSLVGETVGPFQIIEVIDVGGMGTVYRAHHTVLDRDVAFKVPNEVMALSDRFTRMFRREGQTLASLRHPHIVSVYDAGVTQSEIPYLAMAYIEGETVTTTIRREGPLPHQIVARWGLQLAEALTYLDTQHVLHRDLKSSNILVNPDGDVILTDFGLAGPDGKGKWGSQQPGFGSPLFATPVYACPEHGTGKADGRCDLYSLGVVLYECLTGRLPSQESKKMNAPAWLRRIVQKCLAKQPDDRFASAAELASALRLGRRKQLRITIPVATALLLAILWIGLPRHRPPSQIQSLIDAGAYGTDSLYTRMIEVRETGNLVFGSREDFPYDPSPCYIFVFDEADGTLNAVLTPGNTERLDLLSNTSVHDVSAFLQERSSIWVYLVTD